MWAVSKTESNRLSENKMISILIRRHVSLLYVAQSNILWLTLLLSYHYRCNIVFTNYRFPVSFLLYIATQKKILTKSLLEQFYEYSYHQKKITLARFACLCLDLEVTISFAACKYLQSFSSQYQCRSHLSFAACKYLQSFSSQYQCMSFYKLFYNSILSA